MSKQRPFTGEAITLGTEYFGRVQADNRGFQAFGPTDALVRHVLDASRSSQGTFRDVSRRREGAGRLMSGGLDAMMAYKGAHCSVPPAKLIQHMLDPDAAFLEYRPWMANRDAEDVARWEEDGSTDKAAARRELRRAGLQIAASMLMDQLHLQHSAEYDMTDGVRDFNAAMVKIQAYYAPKPGRKPKRR